MLGCPPATFDAQLPVPAAISSLIDSADSGDQAAADALFAALNSELHRLARRQLAGIGSDLTLRTTTLLHEAYLDMARRIERDGGAAHPAGRSRLPLRGVHLGHSTAARR